MNKLYQKNILSHPTLYVADLTKNERLPYLVFIHGGPGYNSAALEYLILHEGLFNTLNCNIILYDQRGCGRSDRCEEVRHQTNIEDLRGIYQFLLSQNKSIALLVGHSYGAKLLCDFYKKFSCKTPGIFLSTSKSLLAPRLNNLLLDMNFLKAQDPVCYQKMYDNFTHFNFEKLWEMTGELIPIFQKNPSRVYAYWANMERCQQVQEVQRKLNLPINFDVLSSVRKDIYVSEKNCLVEIESLTVPYLWINGFQDYIMGSQHDFGNPHITLFYQSAHYPHIEENQKFCGVVNEFIWRE